MKRKASPLPDLDDDEFTRRLKPLEAMMLSHSEVKADHNSVGPEEGQTGYPAVELTGYSANRIEPITTPQSLSLSVSGIGQSGVIRNSGIPDNQNVDLLNKGGFRPGHSKNPEGLDGQTVGNSAVRTDMQLRDNSGVRTESPGTPRGQWTGVIGAAERLVHIEQTRGPKRRFEYLIPQRVGDALAKDAVRQGKSATVLLLEVLRDAGYPVIPEDLIDLRKERRR